MHFTNSLIPRTILFGNPEKSVVRISPKGDYLSYVAPYKGVLNIWIQKLDGTRDAKPMTFDKGRGIRNYMWAYDNQHILYIQDKDGDENWCLYALNIKTNGVHTYVDKKNVQTRFIHSSKKYPHKYVIGINDRTPNFHDLYALDLKEKSLKKLYENNEFVGFMLDDDFNLKLAIKMNEKSEHVWMKKEEGDWAPFISFSHEDSTNSGPVCLSRDGQSVYMMDSRGGNFANLTLVDLKTQKSRKILESNNAEMSVVFHDDDKIPVWYTENRLKPKRTIIDKKYVKDYEILDQAQKGFPLFVSADQADQKWIVAYLVDAGPTDYYMYDRQKKSLQYLFSNQPALENVPLQPMHGLDIPSRDGLRLACYLTLPAGHTMTSASKLPTVLLVHGGPEARDSWGYNSEHQWLANRGYAVMSVNYRGSSGFGKQFVAAGDGEWAGKMHDDLIDATTFLIQKNISDPQKIAIMGGSYGGYATLVGLTMTPDFFACGVCIVGMSNLITLYKSFPPYWKPIIENFKLKIGGDPNTETGRKIFEKKSPLFFVDQIKKPLIIAHGANDPRVKQAEADQIVEAMEKNGIPVTYALYPDEGHGFARPENRISFYALTEKFLAHILGGRYEGQDVNDPKGSMKLKEVLAG